MVWFKVFWVWVCCCFVAVVVVGFLSEFVGYFYFLIPSKLGCYGLGSNKWYQSFQDRICCPGKKTEHAFLHVTDRGTARKDKHERYVKDKNYLAQVARCSHGANEE